MLIANHDGSVGSHVKPIVPDPKSEGEGVGT